jgi:hypothetical protein
MAAGRVVAKSGYDPDGRASQEIRETVSHAFETEFLAEVEWRAGASREEMLAYLAKVKGYCNACRWVSAILGASKP